MIRPRLLDARASGLPQAVGLCPTDIISISAVVNEATERLINDPLAPDEGWWGSWVRMAFNVSRSEPTIVTPQEVARVILMDVCKHPVFVRNQFYEFLQFGPGFQPKGCQPSGPPGCHGLAAYERETVVTFEPLAATPQTIRAYVSDPNDLGKTALVQGADANGNTIFFTDAATGQAGKGEAIVLSSPFTDTTNQFSSITGIQKQRTFGEVQFFQVDPDTLEESPLVTMQPSETSALYRRYFINGLPNGCCPPVGGGISQVLAMCKLDYIPVQSDSDYLGIMSVPALLDECMSIRFSRMDTPSAQILADKKHANALRLLYGQLDHVLGKQSVAVQRHIFGSDRLRLAPV